MVSQRKQGMACNIAASQSAVYGACEFACPGLSSLKRDICGIDPKDGRSAKVIATAQIARAFVQCLTPVSPVNENQQVGPGKLHRAIGTGAPIRSPRSLASKRPARRPCEGRRRPCRRAPLPWSDKVFNGVPIHDGNVALCKREATSFGFNSFRRLSWSCRDCPWKASKTCGKGRQVARRGARSAPKKRCGGGRT